MRGDELRARRSCRATDSIFYALRRPYLAANNQYPRRLPGSVTLVAFELRTAGMMACRRGDGGNAAFLTKNNVRVFMTRSIISGGTS